MDLNPSLAGFHDRKVILELKEMASMVPISPDSHRKYRIIILREADKLTKDAQQALRRVMEKATVSSRFILTASSLSPILAPIRSRCLCLRVPLPTVDELSSVLLAAAANENIAIDKEKAAGIAVGAERNGRRALHHLAIYATHQELNREFTIPYLYTWQTLCADIAHECLQKQSPQVLIDIRPRLYDMLAKCIPGTTILVTISNALLAKVEGSLQCEIISWAAFYVRFFLLLVSSSSWVVF
jgi:replication factor C subunit 3/5